MRRGPTVDRRKKLGVPPGGSFPFAPIAVGTPAREEMGGGRPPKDLSPPASTRRLAAAVALLDQIPAQENPGSRNPRGCSVFSLAAVLPGGSWCSYDRSRRSRGRSSPGLSLSLSGSRTRRHRANRRRCRSGGRCRLAHIARVVGDARPVLTTRAPEFGPGVTVRVHVAVGVRVSLRPGDRRPACWGSQCGHGHETHERFLHSITSIALVLFASRYVRSVRFVTPFGKRGKTIKSDAPATEQAGPFSRCGQSEDRHPKNTRNRKTGSGPIHP